jgi:hypothetical protein
MRLGKLQISHWLDLINILIYAISQVVPRKCPEGPWLSCNGLLWCRSNSTGIKLAAR